MAVNDTATTYVRKYALIGSSDLPLPTAKYFKLGKIMSRQTAWKIFGAPTRLANALESVAAKIPADQKEIDQIFFGEIKFLDQPTGY